jgi:hypothetical protein
MDFKLRKAVVLSYIRTPVDEYEEEADGDEGGEEEV